MLKGQNKHIDKEQGKTKHEAPRRVNYRATENKNNIGTTALERSVVYTTGGFNTKKNEVCPKSSWTAFKIIFPVIGFSRNSKKCYFNV